MSETEILVALNEMDEEDKSEYAIYLEKHALRGQRQQELVNELLAYIDALLATDKPSELGHVFDLYERCLESAKHYGIDHTFIRRYVELRLEEAERVFLSEREQGLETNADMSHIWPAQQAARAYEKWAQKQDDILIKRDAIGLILTPSLMINSSWESEWYYRLISTYPNLFNGFEDHESCVLQAEANILFAQYWGEEEAMDCLIDAYNSLSFAYREDPHPGDERRIAWVASRIAFHKWQILTTTYVKDELGALGDIIMFWETAERCLIEAIEQGDETAKADLADVLYQMGFHLEWTSKIEKPPEYPLFSFEVYKQERAERATQCAARAFDLYREIGEERYTRDASDYGRWSYRTRYELRKAYPKQYRARLRELAKKLGKEDLLGEVPDTE